MKVDANGRLILPFYQQFACVFPFEVVSGGIIVFFLSILFVKFQSELLLVFNE